MTKFKNLFRNIDVRRVLLDAALVLTELAKHFFPSRECRSKRRRRS